MKFFVVSGMYNTGKTTILNKIGEWLTTVKGYSFISGKTSTIFKLNSYGKYDDVCLVLRKDSRKVVLHSATDDKARIDELNQILVTNPDIDIVITTCRDIEYPRDYFDSIIKPFANTHYLESPMAKITRRGMNYSIAESWYIDNNLLLNKHVLESNPYNI